MSLRWLPAFALILVLVLWTNAILIFAMVSPHRTHLHCVQWVTGPTPVYACSDGHGYALEHGKLIDLGRASSTPYLPNR